MNSREVRMRSRLASPRTYELNPIPVDVEGDGPAVGADADEVQVTREKRSSVGLEGGSSKSDRTDV
jgi:hypothetical protein